MPHPNVTKFVKENGDYVQNDTGDWWVFETGAMMEPHNQFGALIPAFKEVDARQGITPMMVKRTLRYKLFYAQKRLGQNLRAFEELKKELTDRANDAIDACAIPPTADEVNKLHQLKDSVLHFEKLVTIAENEYNPPPPTPTPEQQQRDAAAREKSKACLESIKGIEV